MVLHKQWHNAINGNSHKRGVILLKQFNHVTMCNQWKSMFRETYDKVKSNTADHFKAKSFILFLRFVKSTHLDLNNGQFKQCTVLAFTTSTKMIL